MKSSMWFEASMLALVLIAAAASVALDKAVAHRGMAGAQTAQIQAARE